MSYCAKQEQQIHKLRKYSWNNPPPIYEIGYDNGRAISYNDVVSILEGRGASADGVVKNEAEPVSLGWDPASKEHVISYRGSTDMTKHLATYPTLAFIQV